MNKGEEFQPFLNGLYGQPPAPREKLGRFWMEARLSCSRCGGTGVVLGHDCECALLRIFARLADHWEPTGITDYWDTRAEFRADLELCGKRALDELDNRVFRLILHKSARVLPEAYRRIALKVARRALSYGEYSLYPIEDYYRRSYLRAVDGANTIKVQVLI